MLAEELHPQPPERIGAGEHDLELAAGMRTGVIGERQLQQMLEEVGEHEVAAPMRQAVGEPGHQRRGGDDEQAEADPGADERRQARRGGIEPAGSVPDKASMMWPNSTGSTNCAIASTILASANAPASRASGASRSSTANEIDAQKRHGRIIPAARNPQAHGEPHGSRPHRRRDVTAIAGTMKPVSAAMRLNVR